MVFPRGTTKFTQESIDLSVLFSSTWLYWFTCTSHASISALSPFSNYRNAGYPYDLYADGYPTNSLSQALSPSGKPARLPPSGYGSAWASEFSILPRRQTIAQLCKIDKRQGFSGGTAWYSCRKRLERCGAFLLFSWGQSHDLTEIMESGLGEVLLVGLFWVVFLLLRDWLWQKTRRVTRKKKCYFSFIIGNISSNASCYGTWDTNNIKCSCKLIPEVFGQEPGCIS
jgi:hypothetical protein